MRRYLGVDVPGESCTFSVLSEAGREVQRQVVETNGRALVGYLRHCLEELKGEAEEAMVREAQRYPIARKLETLPGLGPIRVAQMGRRIESWPGRHRRASPATKSW